jgi:hypothetical protein
MVEERHIPRAGHIGKGHRTSRGRNWAYFVALSQRHDLYEIREMKRCLNSNHVIGTGRVDIYRLENNTIPTHEHLNLPPNDISTRVSLEE